MSDTDQLERWRGKVDEKLGNIEKDVAKILQKVENIKLGYNDHEKILNQLNTTFQNCQKAHNEWNRKHEDNHQKKEIQKNREESEKREMSAKKLAAIITGSAMLLGAFVQILMKLFGF